MRTPEGEANHHAAKNKARDRRRAEQRAATVAAAGLTSLPPGLLPGRAGRPAWERHPLERAERDAKDEAVVQSLVEGCSPANRSAFADFLKLRGRRIGPNGRRKYTSILAQIDRCTHGTPWQKWTPDQLCDWKDAMLRRVKPNTGQQYALYPYAFLRQRFALQDRLVPNALKIALDAGPNEDEKKPRRICDDHFLALLDRHKNNPMYQALLWVLWATGFRIGEALSLEIRSVRFADGGVYLTIPPKREAKFRIKYQAREVWVEECTQALKNWLALHPFPGESRASVFLRQLNQHERAPWVPFGPDGAARLIRRTCLDLGIPPIRDHDFRHNRAFRMKKAGVPVEKANNFFGWRDGSAKYEQYGRLVAADLIEDVRRASGSNHLGQVVVNRESEAEAKLRILQDALRLVTDPTAAKPRNHSGLQP